MLKHLVPMMKKMARPLLARRGAAQYPEHDLALAATFLWVIERHSGILLFARRGAAVYHEVRPQAPPVRRTVGPIQRDALNYRESLSTVYYLEGGLDYLLRRAVAFET